MGRKKKNSLAKERLARELLAVGVPRRELVKRFGGHYRKYREIWQETPRFQYSRTLNKLSPEEIKAVKALLSFVAPRFAARWLDVCFRFRQD